MAKVISINRTPGDFIQATRHLSLEERGAYQDILDQIVQLGQDEEPPSLPDDDRTISQLLGCTPARWRAIKKRLCTGPLAVLVVASGRISQPRIVSEIEEAKARIEAASKGGRASGASRRTKREVLRERLMNGRSTVVHEPFDRPSLEPSNGIATAPPTDRELVTSHESQVTKKLVVESVTPRLPKDGLAAIGIVLRTLSAIAPEADADDVDVSLWLRDINPDPWLLAAAICESQLWLDDGRKINGRQIGGLLRKKFGDGWTCEDARGYVEMRTARAATVRESARAERMVTA